MGSTRFRLEVVFLDCIAAKKERYGSDVCRYSIFGFSSICFVLMREEYSSEEHRNKKAKSEELWETYNRAPELYDRTPDKFEPKYT